MASHQKNNIGPWLVLLTVLQHDCIPEEIVCLLCKVISFSRALLVTYSIVDQFFPSEDNDDITYRTRVITTRSWIVHALELYPHLERGKPQ